MFSWLFPWVRRDNDRRIFAFWDGTRKRWADPVRILTGLEEVCPDYEKYFETCRKQNEFAKMPPLTGEVARLHKERLKEATDGLIDATKKAFVVEGFSDSTGKPTGLTDGECIRLLSEFLTYMGGLAFLARPKSVSPQRVEDSLADSPTPNSPEHITTDTASPMA